MVGKMYKPISSLKYELKIKNKIIADRTMKNVLTRDILNRDLFPIRR